MRAVERPTNEVNACIDRSVANTGHAAGMAGKSFWNFSKGADGDILQLDGEIVTEADWWVSGQVIARRFRQRLDQCGDVTVYINSPGGDVFAAAAMYSALREHKGHVTVKVTGIAASAASVVAMAGDEILMSPVAYMMIHDPWTVASGNAREFERQAAMLRETSEGLVAAYTQRTGKTRDEIVKMLEAETYMSAQRCVDEGFADGILDFADRAPDSQQAAASTMMQTRNHTGQAILARMQACGANVADDQAECHPSSPQASSTDMQRDEIARRARIIAGLYGDQPLAD